MPASLSLSEAEAGVRSRLLARPSFVALLSVDPADDEPRLINGAPDAVVQADPAEYPRVHYQRVTADAIRPGDGNVTLRFWILVHPHANGGTDELNAITDELMAALDEQWWTYGSARVDAVWVGSGGEQHGEELRRIEDFDVGVG